MTLENNDHKSYHKVTTSVITVTKDSRVVIVMVMSIAFMF